MYASGLSQAKVLTLVQTGKIVHSPYFHPTCWLWYSFNWPHANVRRCRSNSRVLIELFVDFVSKVGFFNIRASVFGTSSHAPTPMYLYVTYQSQYILSVEIPISIYFRTLLKKSLNKNFMCHVISWELYLILS